VAACFRLWCVLGGVFNFSQAQCKLPEDGPNGPKYVGANIKYFNVNFNILYVVGKKNAPYNNKNIDKLGFRSLYNTGVDLVYNYPQWVKEVSWEGMEDKLVVLKLLYRAYADVPVRRCLMYTQDTNLVHMQMIQQVMQMS